MIKVAPTGQKDSVEMRKVYAGFVAKQIEAGSEIIALEADLMSSMAMDGVARDYPQHVINCGIMEANVIGTAAGLSLTGRKPFVHTFTAFASRRCFDQLFMSLDYQRNNVKVIVSLWQEIVLVLTLMVTSKGIAGVPGVSFVVLLATLGSVGIPLEGLAFIAGVDRILDMARTALNVVGNALAVLVIAKWEHKFDRKKALAYEREVLGRFDKTADQ